MNPQHQRLPKVKPLIECFEGLPDPRMDRTRRHKLVDILVMGLCSVLTGGENFADMERFGRIKEKWLKTFLELPCGIPSHDTFNRVFSAIDPYAFMECFSQWVEGICPNLSDEVVAIDGKALRRALNEGQSIPYIVSAWASDHGRIETRRYWQSTDIAWLEDQGLWKGLQSFGMVESLRKQGQRPHHHRAPLLPHQPASRRPTIRQSRSRPLGD